MAGVDVDQLVFVDETGTHTSMARVHARAPVGVRAQVVAPLVAPRNRGVVTTLIAGLGVEGMCAPMTIEGATTQRVFETYVERVLVPALRPGQLVVVDNVGAHKSARAEQLIHDAKCQLVFLPAYSPDFSPVEEAFSKLKAALRAVGARTREALDAAIVAAMDAITPTDARGWFTHCGYPAHPQH